ncbi:MAG TPA: hypothetical protein VFE05_03815 [Longimicrobiaceae bacterium]|jgi:hypothetical protein|nr:hypothetical protein [Longimicrobiaceae bacterium]
MNRLHRIALAAGAALLMAACGTTSDSPLAPTPARHDSGYATGGNYLPTDSTTTTTVSPDAAPAEDGGLATGGN